MPRLLGTIWNKFNTDRYYRNAIIFTIASLVTSGLNYLYYPILARTIGVAGFGELQIITSLILQLSTVFSGLNLISISVLTNSSDEEKEHLLVPLQKLIVWGFIVISLIIILASPQLAAYFHFASPLPFVFLTPALIISAISVFWTAHLQAKHDFTKLSAYSVFTGISKILFSVLFVSIGWGTSGGILGISISLLSSLLLLKIMSPKTLPDLRETVTRLTRRDLLNIKSSLFYIISVVISLIVVSILLSVDVMAVKRLFDPIESGHYAGVSTIARIMFFATAPLVAVMLPSISLADKNATNRAFIRCISLSLLVCVVGAIPMILFPNVVVGIILGHDFINASKYLSVLVGLSVLATVTNVCVNYMLALRQRWTLSVTIVMLAMACALLFTFNKNPYMIAASLSATLLAYQLFFWVWYVARQGPYASSV